MNIHFDIDNFLKTPRVVLFGMLGVFIALTIIYLAILLLSKIFKNKKKKDSGATEE
ncbi:MAG TPA: OadG family transporter subunit [Clostridia bacterium]|jgi:hypothetical protein|nr:hypothetical protein [Clostridiaceae bacterium]HOF27237.1 OadG family transporter subunit [Clostridia bacterium]HOM35162.1 OadG family transporter subunit [Clostridia bacterium]HOR90236.1 OadG family transporter subunit [Clostridia bacterium]HOT71065.1 OadG family transporter subunit [Clostridia bacterium]